MGHSNQGNSTGWRRSVGHPKRPLKFRITYVGKEKNVYRDEETNLTLGALALREGE